MAAKPIVDGIEREHSGRLTIIRVDVQEHDAKPLMKKYNFQYTPTFILIGRNGQEVWRTIGAISPAEVRQLLAELP